jgi:enoyl-CoA hydratase
MNVRFARNCLINNFVAPARGAYQRYLHYRGTAVHVGQYASIEKRFESNDLKSFAELSNDFNPLHFDSTFAATTRFKRPIVHGMLVSSLFSGLIAGLWPGDAIYVEQSTRFVKPIFVSQPIVASVNVVAIKNQTITLETIVKDEKENVCIDGKAIIFIPQEKQQ